MEFCILIYYFPFKYLIISNSNKNNNYQNYNVYLDFININKSLNNSYRSCVNCEVEGGWRGGWRGGAGEVSGGGGGVEGGHAGYGRGRRWKNWREEKNMRKNIEIS